MHVEPRYWRYPGSRHDPHEVGKWIYLETKEDRIVWCFTYSTVEDWEFEEYFCPVCNLPHYFERPTGWDWHKDGSDFTVFVEHSPAAEGIEELTAEQVVEQVGELPPKTFTLQPRRKPGSTMEVDVFEADKQHALIYKHTETRRL